MKKKLLIPVFLCVSFFSEAQNIGINTTNPQATLDLRGNQRIGGIKNYVRYDSTIGGNLHIFSGFSGITPFFSSRLVVESDNHSYVNLLATDPFETGILFGNGSNPVSGLISYNNTTVPKGFIFSNNGNQTRMVITNSGNVGIGTTAPAYPLVVVGNSTSTGNFVNTNEMGYGLKVQSNYAGIEGRASFVGSGERFGVIGYGNGGTAGHYGVLGSASGGQVAYGIYGTASEGIINWAGFFNGDVFATFYSTSDRKLKNDITPLTDAMSIINQLKPSFYSYKTTEYKQMHLPEGIHYGLIADEVLQVLPGTVKKALQPAVYENDDQQNGKKLNDTVEFNAVNYAEMIPIMIGGMKEQKAIIEKQQQQINELQKEIELIKAKLK
jgi:endosialidase-like protein